MKQVKKEMADLENCQKELSEARAELKELIAKEKAEAEKKAAAGPAASPAGSPAAAPVAAPSASPAGSPVFAAESAKVKAAREREKKAEQMMADAEARLEGAEGGASAEDKRLAVAEAEAAKEEEAHQEAEKADLEKTEQEMKEASSRLRKIRHGEDSGGGVSYEKPCDKTPKVPPVPCVKSGAAMPFKLQLAFLAAFAAMIACA